MNSLKNILSPTVEKIYRAWEKSGRSERPRDYLGASELGHECEMYLWLKFRGVVRESFSGRMYRLFDRGQREESVFVEDLKRIGCDVKDRDANGLQFAVSALGGHFAGHLDAIACGIPEAPKTWHVVEMKTHNEASFKKLLKNGVKDAKPMHYAQMQVYMGLSEADRALYVAVDKNSDDLYSERVKFSKAEFDNLMLKAKRIITTSEPMRCANRADDYRCKGCPGYATCWDKSTLVLPSTPITCRTCCFSTAVTEGEGKMWTCTKGHSCSTQKEGCSDYLILPTFVDADIKEGTDDSITYTKNGIDFTVGKGQFSVDELKKLTIDEIEGVKKIKKSIPLAVVTDANTLEKKYADGETLFSGSIEELRGYLKGLSWGVDWSKPTLNESVNGKEYFEYASTETLVIIDSQKNNGTLKSFPIPF